MYIKIKNLCVKFVKKGLSSYFLGCFVPRKNYFCPVCAVCKEHRREIQVFCDVTSFYTYYKLVNGYTSCGVSTLFRNAYIYSPINTA